MGKKDNINKVLILGSGPIVIGQACEFDYSGTQACKALMKEGLEVILVNSNPATIMTDPELATRVYIEPLKVPFVEKIIAKERPDAVIPTLGGQTALNLALKLNEAGVLKKYDVELLGATPDVILRAEDRELFQKVLDEVGAEYTKSELVRTFEQGLEAAKKLNYPLILRPNFTLGGGGGGVAYSLEEYKKVLTTALQASPTSEVLVEESLLGWKEFELEVMRDRAGTFVVICSIENLDPCGVHTGDSITVAPQQTLTDREYQEMRTEAQAILEKVGVETGGANIQFAVDPVTGKRVVIEMNPRVSRSSALASKATGFPIAKIAALLSIGYRLDEIKNDITKVTPSCYEPALDYVVTKIPRFAFEKFSGTEDALSTQMKSVGEVMGIGRTFKESLLKALASMESSDKTFAKIDFKERYLSHPNSKRIHVLAKAFELGQTVEDINRLTHINEWFLEQIKEVVDFKLFLTENYKDKELDLDVVLHAKRMGLTDGDIAEAIGVRTEQVREFRFQEKLHPQYLQVDTCAGEFASETPYFYSSYWGDGRNEKIKEMQAIAILGSGPNRIGQGIEFDYGCVRAVHKFQDLGKKVAMINSNPETVSTDYDTADILFFEPLTEEAVEEVFRYIQPEGFVAQLGGQTPINLAASLSKHGYHLLGSPLEVIDLAEDREKFSELCREFDFEIPRSGMASSLEKAEGIVNDIGYPVICRPSYVIGGRRMEVIENINDLKSYFFRHGEFIDSSNPCLIDEFLEGALEVDIDIVCGRDWSIIGGIVEHIEAAGVHSGDSMGVIPPQRLKMDACEKIEKLSLQLAQRMGVLGHLNLQLAIKNDRIYMLEANPRSSRSVPFVSKSTTIPLVDMGVMAVLNYGKDQIDDLFISNGKYTEKQWRDMDMVAVKGVVFPFKKFADVDSILGPEMKSTGESMGRGIDYSEALYKAFESSQHAIPSQGEVFLSLRDKDKETILPLAKKLLQLGYTLSATTGTGIFLQDHGVDCLKLKKVHEGRPNCVDRIRSGKVSMVINTTTGRKSIEASFGIRRSCIDYGIPCITESDVADSFVLALGKMKANDFSVYPLSLSSAKIAQK